MATPKRLLIRLGVPVLLALVLAPPAWSAVPPVVHHRLEVTLQPDAGRIRVVDRLTWPQAPPAVLELTLNDGLRLTQSDARETSPGALDAANRRRYRVRLDPGASALTLAYEGLPQLPHHVPSPAMPPVVVDTEGVYLDGSSAWYPQIERHAITAELTVNHSPAWRSISQGRALTDVQGGTTRWRSDQPQEEIYLLAGPYHRYAQPGQRAEAQVFLRSPDAALAQRYLALTDRYLDLYSRLIGAYPYSKFAVVENRWETGFGMPSFTLLGPRVMRLPFILESSYPHEILHNWWGNSVYPDYATGNWAEGLTSYLADHLLQEQRGQGADYRRAALQKYADYVGGERDFALREFRARHDGASQAVGYGKSLMFFHMLRRRLGDAAFREGLQRVYQRWRYRVVDFAALQREFEAASGEPLAEFFAQWIEHAGAPRLAVDQPAVSAGEGGAGFRLRLRLSQLQAGGVYELRVPVAITLAGEPRARLETVTLRTRAATVTFDLPQRPLRVDVDPHYDLFRRLAPEELPPALGQLFGAERLTLVVPGAATAAEREAYRLLGAAWRRQVPRLVVQEDDRPLPESGAVWVLGAANRHAPALLEEIAARYPVTLGEPLRLGEERLAGAGLSLALTHRRSTGATIGYLQAADSAVIAALARKLPHYGRYSYVAFRGAAADNVAKGFWTVDASPLTVQLTKVPHPRAELRVDPPLIE